MKNELKYVLAIDTSCDDCAVAILKVDGEICADVVSSQDEVHALYGGVVPEISSRQHLELISMASTKALNEAKLAAKDISAVAVTCGPGLIGALLVGAQFGKGFAQALSIPFIGIHHIEGHLMAANGLPDFPEKPFLALIVSGGHSAIYRCDKDFSYQILGETRDDAAGEAFDKVGRLLGLQYPAGKQIDLLADQGDADKYDFPVAMKAKTTLDYSFSGLKTASRLLIEKLKKEHGSIEGQLLFDICAGLRKAIVTALLNKAFLACQQQKIDHLVLGGGVTANALLRSEAKLTAKKEGIKVYIPAAEHCTDNAVMIARAGLCRLQSGQVSKLSSSVQASIAIDETHLMKSWE